LEAGHLPSTSNGSRVAYEVSPSKTTLIFSNRSLRNTTISLASSLSTPMYITERALCNLELEVFWD